ncbi:MAG: hypothetical protein C0597_06775 [Marinilabiliales bacterium]|nr:MAG: hypothetical protein C0597_06775 [Marinilabiliales bacterium]
MKHTVDVNIHDEICTIKVTGVHNRPEDSYKLLAIAGQVSKENGCSSFIFDMQEAKIISTTMSAALETVLKPEKYGVSNQFQIAVVYQKIQKDHLFMESVGASRGARAFKIFDNLEKAQNWISARN